MAPAISLHGSSGLTGRLTRVGAPRPLWSRPVLAHSPKLDAICLIFLLRETDDGVKFFFESINLFWEDFLKFVLREMSHRQLEDFSTCTVLSRTLHLIPSILPLPRSLQDGVSAFPHKHPRA